MKKYIIFILLIICNCGILFSQEISTPEDPVPWEPGEPVGPDPSEPNMMTYNLGILTGYSSYYENLYTECMFIYNDYTSFEDAMEFEVNGIMELNFTFTNQSEYDCLMTLYKKIGDTGISVIKNFPVVKGTEKTGYIVLDAGKYQIRPTTPCGYRTIDIAEEAEVTPITIRPLSDQEYIGPENLGRKGPYIINIQAQKNVTFNFSNNRNYINTRTYTSDKGIDFIDGIQYFDGLGRLVETVQVGVTPLRNDLVALQEYDNYGRQSNSWLPALSSQNGAFVYESDVKNAAIQLNNDQKPYAKTAYEDSPLNRVTTQFRVGANWHDSGSAVRTGYLTNDNTKDSLKCILYKVNGTGTSTTLVKSEYYAEGSLLITRVTDEEDRMAYEFKDKLGQVLLTRSIAEDGYLDTYYVYDKAGNLCYVLPPLAANTGELGDSSNTLLLYAYLYKYDKLNRCISKRIPGCDWIYYVYDRADNLIFTQDGEQRKDGKDEWSFTIPDAHGRIVLTGICKNTLNYAVNPLDNIIVKGSWTNVTNTYKGYSITGVTLTTPQITTVNYYDNYEFLGKNSIPNNSSTQFTELNGYGSWHENNSKGLLTGTLTAQLGTTSNTTFLYTAMYYDNRARMVQAKSNNHLNGTDFEYVSYNFTGQPLKRMNIHKIPNKPDQTEEYTYSYDHAGRLVSTQHRLNDESPVILAWNTYDELGRLANIDRGGNGTSGMPDQDEEGITDPVETILTRYAYNVRSWTTAITGQYFSQNLQYSPGGNISRMDWTTNGQKREYDYTYDRMSRLKAADYTGIGNEQYGTSYTYDKHGNIKTMQRYGKKDAGSNAVSYGLVDNLTMDCTGNQLIRVADAIPNFAYSPSADFKDKVTATGTIEYTYNKNGSMESDFNKGITKIQYNSLNLPQVMVINSPTVKAKNYYTYSASGVKLRTEQRYDPTMMTAPITETNPTNDGLSDYKITDYISNIVYETIKSGQNITNRMRIIVNGGYIEDGQYYFYLGDHLGNNRIVVRRDGTVVQKNHYYPFGMEFAENSGESDQPYKYNGKELDKMHGLNMYDYLARYMEPALGRFTTVDPLAEKYYSWSPYSFVLGNPIKNIDPLGMDVWSTNDPDQIAQFLSHLQAVAGNTTTDPFDYGGWNRMTEDEYEEQNKDNSVSFNDDTFNFNINMDDYQGNFKVGMRSKETNYAYITSSDLDVLLDLEGEYDNGLSLGAGHLVGPTLILLGDPVYWLKPVGALGSPRGSSIASAGLSKVFSKKFSNYTIARKFGIKRALGTATVGRALGRFVPYAGWSITIGYTLNEAGVKYGGKWWVNRYKESQRNKKYQPTIQPPK